MTAMTAFTPQQQAVAVAMPTEPVVDPAACQKLWMNVLIAVLEDMGSEREARAYLQSRDGRMVLAFAGVEGFRRIDLAGMRALRATLLLNRASRVLSIEEQEERRVRRAEKCAFRTERKIRRAAERAARGEPSNV